MSEFESNDDLIQDYLAESREHLATIENDLLAMERAGDEVDEQLVNRVFRAAHSIKGGAGFFGFQTIRDLAHRTENVLDLVRSRRMVPDAEVTNLLLLAFDKLRELVNHHSTSNQADIQEFVESLTALAAANLPADQKHSVTDQVSVAVPREQRRIEVSAFDLNQARLGGKVIYLIEYDLLHDVQRRGRTPLDVIRALVKTGNILETRFDLASAGTLDDEPSNGLIWEVLYATVLEPDLINQLVEVPPERIRVIEKNGNVKTLTEVDRQPHGEVEPLARPAPPMPGAGTAGAGAAAPAAASTSAAAQPGAPQHGAQESTIRLNVALLDSLVSLAGELVLSRNHLNEALARSDSRAIQAGAQRVGAVTSELQEVILLTRLQPVGTLFAKFPRLVRDLARDLGKDARLEVADNEVEIDKNILEALSDPLTHIVRNAIDHGVEAPAGRVAAGKPTAGIIALRAYHQAGQVVIEIADDGKGIDGNKVAAAAVNKGLISREKADSLDERGKIGLIFLPGLSTAEKVTGVSGRGVGMDVVRTNLEQVGGKVEIDSHRGKGSCFRIKLPLTLAILPSLLVSCEEERFAVPQVNIKELLRIPAAQIAQRTTRVGTAPVLILRDRLLPLVWLSDVLGAARPEAGGAAALNVIVLDTGTFEYGLVVGQLHTTSEIVVKPLGRRLEALKEYAGATILGDGRVALILDVAGVAARAGLSAAAAEALAEQAKENRAGAAATAGDRQALLLFNNAPHEPCGLPLNLVARVERIQASQIELLGGRRTMQYRGASMPLITLRDTAAVDEIAADAGLVVIVIEQSGRPFGVLAAEPLDVTETEVKVDAVSLRQPGIAGSAILKGRTTLLVDVYELARSRPETGDVAADRPAAAARSGAGKVLLAEDSDFFRNQVRRLLEGVGFQVVAATDGQEAWELLEEHGDAIELVATDVEMPRLTGLELTRRIRADSRFAHLPIIALTSLADEDDIAAGLAAGVTNYQVKLNQDDLLEAVRTVRGGEGAVKR
jgi:two-component system, chemotaxis family, sensor kinase CheA